MRIPGFTAIVSVRASETSTKPNASMAAREDRMPAGVFPASAYCRRLLRKCLSGDDPRSFACDSWLILC